MDLKQLHGDGVWTTEPVRAEFENDRLIVEANPKSDAWRVTSYDMIHDSAHGLLEPLGKREAIEVSFILDFDQAYDQAGIMVREDPHNWIKAGVEMSDGFPQCGGVVTREVSDWSAAPVPEWIGREVTFRASRDNDALTIRARVDDEPWRLVRLAPLDPKADVRAGLYLCSPSRGGLAVTFTRYYRGEPDESLH